MNRVLTHCYPSDNDRMSGDFVERWLRQNPFLNHKDVYHFPYEGKMLTETNPFKLFKYLLFSYVTMRSFDKVSHTYVHWFIPFGPLAVMTSRTVEVICHGSDLFYLDKHPLIARMLKPFAKRVHQWRFVSSHLAHLFNKIYPDISLYRKHEVLPMPINTDVFFKEPNATLDLGRDKRYVTCSALVPRKRVVDLISYLNMTGHFLNGGTLTVIGDGPMRYEIEAYVAHLPFGSVVITGQLPQNKIAKIFRNSSRFYLFSKDEGLGLVIAEAKACGCKTYVTSGDGKAEIADVVIDEAII